MAAVVFRAAMDEEEGTEASSRQGSAAQGSACGERKSLGNANRNERSRGRSLPHGQDMGRTQNHRNSTEQWLADGGGWRLVAVGGWRLVAVGGWRLALGGWWSLGAVLNKKNGGS